jgi:Mg-chelatase subunit ChlD
MAKQPAKRSSTPASTKRAAAPRRAPAKKSTAVTPAADRRTRTKPTAAPLPQPVGKSKFTLYNFLAQERGWYLVEPHDVPRPAQDQPEKSVAHAIIIVDRSGSMYGTMPDLKTNLLKLLTLDEYSRSDLLVTLISYSSRGDVTCHFERTPITQIMKPNSREQKQIQDLRPAALTCPSQALEMALRMMKDDELTAITLHTDGYANDPSANSETKALDGLCDQLKPRDAFVNTIAYSDYADYRLLSKIANTAGGNCIRTGNIQQVYDSLYNTAKILDGSVSPPVEMPLDQGFDYQIFVSHAAEKLNGSAGTLRLCGLKVDDDARAYKFRRLTRDEYEGMKDVPEAQTSEPVFAFARAQLAEGNLNTAKYAVASTFDATLAEKHSRALTNPQIADLATDLEDVLFNPDALPQHVLQLVRLLEEHKTGYQINLKHLQQNYGRRGVRRVQGTRDDAGNLIEPWLTTEFVDDGTYLPVSSFDVNRNTATLNMLISRRVRLVPRGGGKPVDQVAGIKLDNLSTFNNYTLISDGDLNVRTLQLKISDPKLFDRLSAEGVLELNGEPPAKYDPKAEYTLRLEILPLVPPFEGEVKLDGLFNELAELKVLSSIVAAHMKEASAAYTPEQVEELKKYYLSKSLFLSFPTTTEYTNLQDALAVGSVDTRVSYKIDIGSKQILNLGKLHSANKFLDRIYEVTVNGVKAEKPTFEQALEGNVSYKPKQLTARTKVTPVDAFMKRIFDDFLGLDRNGSVDAILKKVGADKLVAAHAAKLKGTVARADDVAALADAQKKVDAYADKLFTEKVSPLVFYVGSTGLLPDEVQAKAMTAEQLTAKYPELALSKDEQDGTFFEIGDTILTVYAKNEYFSR